jgi:hypothetical protein
MMIEETVVFTVLAFLVTGWFALCFDLHRTKKEALKMAIGFPLMLATIISIFWYVIYCFYVVFN